MIIDIVIENGNQLMRYESTHVPKAGETVTVLTPVEKVVLVTSVDHLVAPVFNSDKMTQQLVTLTVSILK